jgi:hypothetical protein
VSELDVYDGTVSDFLKAGTFYFSAVSRAAQRHRG